MIAYIRVTKKQIINILTKAPFAKRFVIIVVPNTVHPAYDYADVGKRLTFLAGSNSASGILSSLLLTKIEVLDASKGQKVHYYIQAGGI